MLTYENKYNDTAQKFCPPITISVKNQKKARNLALVLHKLCGCRDLSRTDMIVTPTDKIYVLETNTFPGMTKESIFSTEAAVAGIPMDELIDTLVQMALSRKQQ